MRERLVDEMCEAADMDLEEVLDVDKTRLEELLLAHVAQQHRPHVAIHITKLQQARASSKTSPSAAGGAATPGPSEGPSSDLAALIELLKVLVASMAKGDTAAVAAIEKNNLYAITLQQQPWLHDMARHMASVQGWTDAYNNDREAAVKAAQQEFVELAKTKQLTIFEVLVGQWTLFAQDKELAAHVLGRIVCHPKRDERVRIHNWHIVQDKPKDWIEAWGEQVNKATVPLFPIVSGLGGLNTQVLSNVDTQVSGGAISDPPSETAKLYAAVPGLWGGRPAPQGGATPTPLLPPALPVLQNDQGIPVVNLAPIEQLVQQIHTSMLHLHEAVEGAPKQAQITAMAGNVEKLDTAIKILRTKVASIKNSNSSKAFQGSLMQHFQHAIRRPQPKYGPRGGASSEPLEAFVVLNF
jgi:hypothetical protein